MKLVGGIWLLISILGGISAQEPTPTPVALREEFVVTVNRVESRIGDTPASVVTFSRVEIAASAAPTIDDILRQSPGFSIFRRSSSRNANPTTQGVSLRGVGSSGASRTAVMFDGVPLNDPFGGWVQWNRINPIAVESVEILRGGASSLYGDYGLSGAINIRPRQIEKDKYLFSADIFGGGQRTISGSGFAGLSASGWLASLTASNFQTRGYRPVDEAVRGTVDVFAGVRTSSFSARLSREIGDSGTIFVVPSYFGEVRTNGTGLQTNRTHSRQIYAGGEFRRITNDLRFNWRAFAGNQLFDQVFSVVNATRTAETLNRLQRVPAAYAGFSGNVSTLFKSHTFLAGVDVRKVRGANNEFAFAGGNHTIRVEQAGREITAGVFVQDIIKIGEDLVVVGTLRYDRWRNYSAFSVSRTLATGLTAINGFPDRGESAVSPKIAVLYRLSKEVSFYANASKSFRAPTLNELYRGFRVGSVATLANEGLRSERANNFEAGMSASRNRTSVRATGFWTTINGAISNVTLATTPSLITRQRQNAGRTRSRGVEIEGQRQVGRFDITAGYLLADSTVVRFVSNPLLERLMIPQVARHSFTLQVRYSIEKWMLATQGRMSSNQFDDDLNRFELGAAAQFDVFASRRVNKDLQIYGAVENIFNSRTSVGRTPIRTVNSPLNFRLGIRFK